MSVKSAIVAILLADAGVTALVGNRIYPQVSPSQAAHPMIVYQVVSDVSDQGLSVNHQLNVARFSFACIGQTSIDAEAVESAIASALDRYAGTSAGVVIRDVRRETAAAIYDDLRDGTETPDYREDADYLVWYRPN